jgi:hypothetical protein
VLSAASAAAFRAFVAEQRKAPAVDEESFRLITGFNDIFVVIACGLLLAALVGIGITFVPWLGAALAAPAAWLLAEFFTRQRRMALPSIVLLLAFAGAVLATGLLLLPRSGVGISATFTLAAIAVTLHWLRFRVPITVAAGAAVLIGGVLALMLVTLPWATAWIDPLTLLLGVAVFAIAMRWDAADPERQTRASDVAFWLHLLAAPLVVHPIFSMLELLAGDTSLLQALVVVVLYVMIALVSLSVDRRALMVSALAYVLYAFGELLEQFGVVNLGFAVTALVIGSALLLLSAFWHTSRAALLRHFPAPVLGWLAPLR